MTSPFCKTCGTLITTQRKGQERKLMYWCPTCKRQIGEEEGIDDKAFQEQSRISHTEREKTRIIENEAPPIPKLMTQTFKQRQKKRCRHPNATFQGFYQFSSGDEASRKYWYCPDCGQVFRYSGKINVKSQRKLIHSEEGKKDNTIRKS
jgi:DNA-directed RNA polymerase subunit M/transcription elongation factor TFIIS